MECGAESGPDHRSSTSINVHWIIDQPISGRCLQEKIAWGWRTGVELSAGDVSIRPSFDIYKAMQFLASNQSYVEIVPWEMREPFSKADGERR
jgi:hypothetical protein